jgi:hypothetical protein
MIASALNQRRRSVDNSIVGDLTEDATLTVDQRLVEVAAILAAGVLRLRSRAALPPPANCQESCQNRLEDCARKRLSGQRG